MRIDQLTRVLRYAAAGTMPLDQLRAEMERYWSGYRTDDAQEVAELRPWEREITARFVRAEDCVLVVGCGDGRDMLPLIEMGHRVTGVEPAPCAVAAARRALAERHLAGEVLRGFIEDVPLADQFDVINFSDYCYSLIPESRRRVEVLRKAVGHLTESGRILITAFLIQAHRPDRVLNIARAFGRWCRSDWTLERGDHISSAFENDRVYVTFSHEFTLDELHAEVSEAGLHVAYRHPNVPAFVLTTRPPGATAIRETF